MSLKHYTDVELMGGAQVLNAKLSDAILNPVTSDPSSPETGAIWFNSTQGLLKFYDGTEVKYVNAGQIENLTVGNFTTSSISTDIEADKTTDNKITTPKAVADYVTANSTSGGIILKGVVDASANPNYSAAVTGDAYRITVAGKIGGTSGIVVEAGDLVIAHEDNAGGDHAAVGASWFILQANVGEATQTDVGLVRFATSTDIENNEADVVVSPGDINTILSNKRQLYALDGTSGTISGITSMPYAVMVTHHEFDTGIDHVYPIVIDWYYDLDDETIKWSSTEALSSTLDYLRVIY